MLHIWSVTPTHLRFQYFNNYKPEAVKNTLDTDHIKNEMNRALGT